MGLCTLFRLLVYVYILWVYYQWLYHVLVLHIFALQPKGMVMYGLLKSMSYALYSGYLFRLLV